MKKSKATMKRYLIDNDEVIYASTGKQFMERLWRGSFCAADYPDLNTYILDFDKRLKMTKGVHLTCGVFDFDGMVEQLQACGFIHSIEDVDNLNAI